MTFFLPLLHLPLVFVIVRPNTYHSNLQVSWDLNTGVCCTVGVGDLTEVRGQTRWRVTAHRQASCWTWVGFHKVKGVALLCFSCQWERVELVQEVLCKHGDEVVDSREQLPLHQPHDQWSSAQGWAHIQCPDIYLQQENTVLKSVRFQ